MPRPSPVERDRSPTPTIPKPAALTDIAGTHFASLVTGRGGMPDFCLRPGASLRRQRTPRRHPFHYRIVRDSAETPPVSGMHHRWRGRFNDLDLSRVGDERSTVIRQPTRSTQQLELGDGAGSPHPRNRLPCERRGRSPRPDVHPGGRRPDHQASGKTPQEEAPLLAGSPVP